MMCPHDMTLLGIPSNQGLAGRLVVVVWWCVWQVYRYGVGVEAAKKAK